MKTISFIGAGNMAFAMANALYNKDKSTAIGVFDINEKRIELFKSTFDNTKNYLSILELANSSDIIILAVKPQVIGSVLELLSNSKKIIVSIAAGITLDYLTEKLPLATVVRVMPNTPSLVGAMAAGVSFSDGITKDQKNDVLNFLSYSGLAIEVLEKDMDAVTGVSGSGPAFAARIMKHFIDAGVNHGLDEETSRALTLNTFLGTAKLLLDKDMDIENLITMVSSPGGTTIAGRSVLENSSIGSIIHETVDATVIRSKELGKK